jgi:hypothetical protein
MCSDEGLFVDTGEGAIQDREICNYIIFKMLTGIHLEKKTSSDNKTKIK